MRELIKLIPGSAEISYIKSIEEKFMKVLDLKEIEIW